MGVAHVKTVAVRAVAVRFKRQSATFSAVSFPMSPLPTAAITVTLASIFTVALVVVILHHEPNGASAPGIDDSTVLAAKKKWWPPAQLKDDASCVAAGVSPELTKYRKAIVLENTYKSASTATVFAPVFSSLDLDSETPNEHITTAVVFMHGLGADAQTYFCDGVAAVAGEGLSSSVLVLSPWFGSEQATLAEWVPGASSNSDTRSAYWSGYRWVKGGNASPSPARYTTAFDVLDAVVKALAAAKSSGRFPKLKRVTMNGFSAGAQVLSRWAFFSKYGNGMVDLGVTVRTIVADGSSYLYLDDSRPESSCSEPRDTGTRHTCSSFVAPDSASCPGYNDYKWGLDLVNAETNMYLEPFKANDSLVQAATTAYLKSSEIRFIFGDKDVCNCNTKGYSNTQSEVCYPSGTSCSPNAYGGQHRRTQCCDTYPDTTTHNALAVHCQDLLQGTNRLQRGINYMAYLESLRARHLSSRRKQHKQKKDKKEQASETFGFFSGGHNNAAFYASSLFKQWAY